MVGFQPTSHAEHDAMEKKTKPATINYVAAIFAAIGSFLFGYDSGIIGSVIAESYDQFHDYFHHPGENVTGAVVSVFAGGAFFGALLAGQTADCTGRKRTIQLRAGIATVGCAIQAGSVHIAMLILGRFIAGVSIGVLSMIVPVFQSEISPPHARGLLSGWTQLTIVWGFFVANWVSYGCQFLRNWGQWRIPLAIQITPALLLFVGMFFLPYSPRWLAAQGRLDEAKATLFRLQGGSRNADRAIVEEEFDEMVNQINWEKENLQSSFKDLVADKPSIHRTLCRCLVQAVCQWTGVNVNNQFVDFRIILRQFSSSERHTCPHSLSTTPTWLNNVIIGQITPYGFKHLGYKYFFIYVATNVSNAVVSYFIFPETKGLTLEEIGLLFGDKNVRTYDNSGRAAMIVESPGTATPESAEKEKVAEVERV